ncbi:MAG TPA: hypothetical protein VFJ77_03805 [Gaiellaceae bacterium]|nr:hypothetical protein [Gaiellaceae bacterium]
MFGRRDAEGRRRRAEEKLARRQRKNEQLDEKLRSAQAKTAAMRAAAGGIDGALAGLRGKDVFVALDGDRIEFRRTRGGSNTYEIDPRVSAEVESAGNLAHRPSLTRVAAGGVIAGPIGAILGGAAWKKQDARELYLLVEGADWTELVELAPGKGGEARKFAQQVNLAARRA